MNNIECPYCKFKWIPDEYYDYKTDERHETECPNCEKIFQWSYDLEPIFSSYQTDCLNDGTHQWIQHNRVFSKRIGWVQCKICGNEEKNEVLWNELEIKQKEKVK